MSPELKALLERAKNHRMTDEEYFEQRVSFVYGQQDYDNPNPLTKDQIRRVLRNPANWQDVLAERTATPPPPPPEG